MLNGSMKETLDKGNLEAAGQTADALLGVLNKENAATRRRLAEGDGNATTNRTALRNRECGASSLPLPRRPRRRRAAAASCRRSPWWRAAERAARHRA